MIVFDIILDLPDHIIAGCYDQAGLLLAPGQCLQAPNLLLQSHQVVVTVRRVQLVSSACF